ncbi:Hypothetical protein EHI5A_009350 [Entamoeba histolytica KU27]|uniref:Uncharacterized protein n=1 Tax=Entamoeba histolytica KU27 TaxID=885311 RepID=M2S0D6_ENTHI|nr:Hypothetical protein EHI5A_009350 [Entamoeba histolytica KU27]
MNEEKNISIYEFDVKQNPQSFKTWWNYIEYFDESHFQSKITIFQRALHELPGSYKLWYHYLQTILINARKSGIDTEIRKSVNEVFEESLVYMNKMPVIWKLYIEWLIENGEITQMRRVFDRSLQSLPIGQHNELWKVVMKFVITLNTPLLFEKLVLRHILLDRGMIGEYIQICKKKGEKYYPLALKLLIQNVSLHSFRMKKEEYDFMIHIFESLTVQDKGIDVQNIMKKGIQEFPEDTGSLWVGMSLYEIKEGRIETGISILEEAMNEVITLRDLYIVRQCYEQVIHNYINKPGIKEVEKQVIEERKEYLLGNQNIQMNLVLLKKEPYNVKEWIERSRLYVKNGDVLSGVKTLIEGIKTIHGGKEINGKKNELWSELIGWYLKGNKRNEAKQLFEKAKEDNLTQREEAEIWYEMIQNEIKSNNINEARALCEEATLRQSKVKNERMIWKGYLEIEEISHNIMGKWSVYEKMIELKIITGRELIEYIKEKKDKGDGDDIWKIYEKGINIFEYPVKGMLYNQYINEWCSLYGEKKKERTRDLFENAIESAPIEWKKKMYDQYIKYEIKNNSFKRVIDLYKKEVNEILNEEKCEVWIKYAQQVDEVFGFEETKKVYLEGLNSIGRIDEWKLSLSFAEYLENQEDIEGAREIFSTGSKRCSVKEHEEYWDRWKEFEERFGSENTFKDYLVTKKTVMKYFGEAE